MTALLLNEPHASMADTTAQKVVGQRHRAQEFAREARLLVSGPVVQTRPTAASTLAFAIVSTLVSLRGISGEGECPLILGVVTTRVSRSRIGAAGGVFRSAARKRGDTRGLVRHDAADSTGVFAPRPSQGVSGGTGRPGVLPRRVARLAPVSRPQCRDDHESARSRPHLHTTVSLDAPHQPPEVDPPCTGCQQRPPISRRRPTVAALTADHGHSHHATHQASPLFCSPNAPSITPAPAGAVVPGTVGGRAGVVVQRGCGLPLGLGGRWAEGWAVCRQRRRCAGGRNR